MNAINNSTSEGVAAWRPACWIRVRGPDAGTFLQGQFTNDLSTLEHTPAVYGLWLSVKGKVLADSFILRTKDPDSFWVCSYWSSSDVIRKRLESHIIADDVELEDFTAEWAGLSLLGNASRAAVPAGADECAAFRGRRCRGPNIEWVGPIAMITAARASLIEWPELDDGRIARIRIADAIPAVPADIGPADLPNEGGLESEAISYTKGCYLGQEVMARLKSMGQVRRRLIRVRGNVGAPALPVPLFAGGRAVGELRSAASEEGGGFIGLAIVSLLHVSAGTELAFSPDAPANVRLLDTP